MNHVNLSRLKRVKNRIDWCESIGEVVSFKYKNIEGSFEIVGYNKNMATVLVKYKDNPIYNLRTSSLRQCQLSGMLKLYSDEFIYDISENIKTFGRDITITDRHRRRTKSEGKLEKAYRYMCNVCGFCDGESNEVNLKNGNGCPVCCNKKIIKGVNDISTTHPELMVYFKNKEDAFVNSYGSTKIIVTQCPLCFEVDKIKITDLRVHGFNCKKCGDGISYPEKIVRNILYQLEYSFIYQYKPKWSNNKKYDYYIKDKNIIIEVHGSQHYEKSFSTIKGAKSLQEEQKNDLLKYNLAIQNGIKPENYIVIDCRKSEFEWIKYNCEKSLNNIFNLSSIDWVKCDKDSTKNIIIEVCNVFNNITKSTKEISKMFNLHYSTISRYLKKGRDFGWCNYSEKQSQGYANRVKIICFNTLEIFDSMSDASKKYNLKVSNISDACKNSNKSAGKDKNTLEKLKWMYYEDYLKLEGNNGK